MSVAPAIVPSRQRSPSFYCPGCGTPRRVTKRHPSSYCQPCILRGHRFWLERWDESTILAVANLIWPEDFERLEAAA